MRFLLSEMSEVQLQSLGDYPAGKAPAGLFERAPRIGGWDG